MHQDTIAAVATGLAEAAIGIVRLSGPEALDIADRLFKPVREQEWRTKAGYRLYYGHIVEPADGRRVDEVVVAVMRAPHSYTREDVVEINAHGGPVGLRRILELVLRAGARAAEPGEFTKRAFLNGRLDLAQAEAVIDIIRARTDDGLEMAVQQLEGKLSHAVEALRERTLEMLASVEASIDFAEEDLALPREDELRKEMADITAACRTLADEGDVGRVYREGLRTVIIGKPNVGKSSLLNALVGEDRAIVTPLPGTTRDTIEEFVDLRGLPLRVVDTAGLREALDEVERVGVERARGQAAMADLLLVMLDASTGITPEDEAIMALGSGRPCVAVVNKVDLAPDGITTQQVHRFLDGVTVVHTAVTSGVGMEELAAAVEQMVFRARRSPRERPLVSNARHRAALARAADSVQRAHQVVGGGEPLELAAADLRAAVEALGEITGAGMSEEILGRIFARFCIGK